MCKGREEGVNYANVTSRTGKFLLLMLGCIFVSRDEEDEDDDELS